jgi:hypothetical protein
MSLPVPFGITLETIRAHRRITRLCNGVQFRSVVPGGFASATVSLQHPLQLMPDEINYFADLTISDTRNGKIVWAGRVEDLGRQASSNGQIWDLSAIGPSAHAQDRTAQYILVDTRVDQWQVSKVSSKNAICEQTTDSPGNPVIKLQAPESAVVTNLFQAEMYYDGLFIAGQHLGRSQIGWDGGRIDSTWLVRTISQENDPNNAPGTAFLLASNSLTTAPNQFDIDVVVSQIPNGHQLIFFRLDCANGQTVPAGAWVVAIPKIRARLKDRNGADVLTGYTLNTVYPHEVVEDLLGRLLPLYDGEHAEIFPTFTAIDQLAYSDGAKPAEVLEDLMTFEPGMYWAAWQKTDTNKFWFEWRPWPTVPRYDATIEDGFESPSSAGELYNSVVVRYVESAVRRKQLKLTQEVQALAEAGITREGFIDLGDEVASLANATTAGNAFLEEHKEPTNAATLTVARPILDRDTGEYVQPWEIRPGNLIRVRGVQLNIDWLNPAPGRNGVTVFRIVAADAGSDGVATLELDAFSPSMARALVNLPKVRPKRKR